jgi:peptide/nickel transport system substrate-binding protein
VQQDVIRVALDWEVDDIDPPCSFGGWNTGRVVQQMFDSLVEDNLNSEIGAVTSLVPSLAVSQSVSPDGLRYTFRLREGVTFHDGATCDADAVRMNIERMWDTSSPYFDERAFDYNRMAIETLKSVRVSDARTIELELTDPFPEFLRYATQEDAPGAFVMVSPEYIRTDIGKRASAPGTGPYALEKRFETPHGDGALLRRYSGYWGRPAATEFIEFTPIPSGENRSEALIRDSADIVYGPDPSSLDELSRLGFIVSERPIPYVWYIALNINKAPLDDVRVRRALLHAIDRKSLSEELFGSATAPMNGILPPASPSYEPGFPDLYPFQPQRARELLAAAGVNDGFTFTFSIARAGSGQLNPVGIAERIRRDLGNVGIGVDLRINEDWVEYCEDWHQGMNSEIDASEMSWGMSCDVWVEQVLHSRNASPRGFNTGYYHNEQVDKMFDVARRELEPEKRAMLYQTAHRLIMLDAPVIPLLTIRRGLVAHHPRVQGLRFPAQNWHNLSDAWLDRSIGQNARSSS